MIITPVGLSSNIQFYVHIIRIDAHNGGVAVDTPLQGYTPARMRQEKFQKSRGLKSGMTSQSHPDWMPSLVLDLRI